MIASFYSDGLKFTCRRCSKCCRIDPGFVYLSVSDIPGLLAKKKITYKLFISSYCRWIPYRGGLRLGLLEKDNFDCVFWENSECTIYDARPYQCRSFPFWESALKSPDDWKRYADDCPGIDSGRSYAGTEIEVFLSDHRSRKWITRKLEERPYTNAERIGEQE